MVRGACVCAVAWARGSGREGGRAEQEHIICRWKITAQRVFERPSCDDSLS